MVSEQNTTSKPWYKKWWVIALGVFVAIGMLGNVGGPEDPVVEAGGTATTVADVVTTEAATATTIAPATTVTTARATTTVPVSRFTRSEENAIKSAEQYLSFSAFSRSGLIDQLEYEGFSVADATLAVDYIDVDWNEQAWKSAEQYLSFSAFSRSGLIDQLEYEGFTKAQATYGVDKTGL